MQTIRLTTGQAVVHFIANQYVERDGLERRFIAGVWGIFWTWQFGGHRAGARGIRRGTQNAALPSTKRAGDGARRGGFCQASKPFADLRLRRQHRTRVA